MVHHHIIFSRVVLGLSWSALDSYFDPDRDNSRKVSLSRIKGKFYLSESVQLYELTNKFVRIHSVHVRLPNLLSTRNILFDKFGMIMLKTKLYM